MLKCKVFIKQTKSFVLPNKITKEQYKIYESLKKTEKPAQLINIKRLFKQKKYDNKLILLPYFLLIARPFVDWLKFPVVDMEY